MRKKTLFASSLLLFLLFTTLGYAQTINVSGHVIDENGNFVAGAVVTVKGSKSSITTNDLGFYSLNAPTGATIEISYVGYLAVTGVVNGPTLDITLKQHTKDLNEVVVTALGIRKEKKLLSYAVTEVKGTELTEARTVNVASSLEGKVAGLNISTPANGPGGSTRIVIRGAGSISQQNQPLIVLDGVPLNNDNINNQIGGMNPGASSIGMWGGADQGDGISSLNPDDIESISVLKGGTAAALYGSRASNGAIIVTTKSASKRANAAVGLDLNSNIVAEGLVYPHFKDYQYEYGIGDIDVTSANPLVGQKPTAADGSPNFQTNSYGAPLDGSQVIQFDGVYRPYVAQKNNMTQFYKTGTTFTNSLSMTGSGDKLSYRFSLSDMNNKGILPDNTLRRDNAALNLVGNMSKWLSFVANVKYIAEKSHNRPMVSDSPGNADYTVRVLPTSLDVKTLQPGADSSGNERYFNNNVYVDNPYFATEKYQRDQTKDRILTSFEPKVNFTDWLYAKGIMGFDQYNLTNTAITPTGTSYKAGGGYTRNVARFNETNVGFIFGLDKKVATDLSVSAFVGGNAMTQRTDANNINGSPFNIPFFYDISNISPANVSTTDGVFEKKINSFYGSADLSYKNVLFLNVTGREDWFSALTTPAGTTGAINKNHIFYPSVGLSYIISDALRLPAFVNYLKARASWAQVGGDTGPYQLSNYYSLTGATGSAPLAQIGPTEIPNKNLQPYSSLSDEVGLEGRLFDNRMSLDLTYYNHNISHDIVQGTASPTSGYTSAVFNAGKITNKGIEALVSYKVINTSNFSWEPGVNLAYNKSEVVSLIPGLTNLTVDEARTQTAYIEQVVGKAYGQITVVPYVRNAAGQVVFTSAGLPATTSNYLYAGSGVSPFTAGFNNSFRYKRWTLNILVDGKFGGKIFDGDEGLAYNYGLAKGTLPGRLTGVIGNGVAPDLQTKNNVTVAAETYYTNLYNFGEPFVYSSDFIKLRSLTLDYTLPAKAIARTPFKGASLSLVGRNLWTIMKHTPIIDPESTYNNGNAQGLEFGAAPVTRTLGLNLNLKF